MKYWREYYLVKLKRKHFDGIIIGDLAKVISCMCLNLQLGVNFNVRVLPKWCSRYWKLKQLWGIFAYTRPSFSWIPVLMVPFFANSACSNFVSYSFLYMVVLLLKLALSLIMKSALMVRELLVCYIYLCCSNPIMQL